MEALQGALVSCLTETESWPLLGFAICLSFRNLAQPLAFWVLHFFQNNFIYASVILFSL
jgi:hypothetical protein